MNFQDYIQNLIFWFLSHGIKIILILIVAYLINQFLKIFIKKTIKNRFDGLKQKRAETLISVFGETFKFIIWIIALLMIISEFGVNIAPILASVGLAGLAIGMAAKDIISDFISGLFILLEDQYSIGDRIKIGGVEGVVQEISLRKTIIKDETNFLHSIPNGQIKQISKKIEKD